MYTSTINSKNPIISELSKNYSIEWIDYDTIILNGVVTIKILNNDNNIVLLNIKEKLYIDDIQTGQCTIYNSLNSNDLNILYILGYKYVTISKTNTYISKENINVNQFPIRYLSNKFLDNFQYKLDNIINYNICKDIDNIDGNSRNEIEASYVVIKGDSNLYLVDSEIVYNYRFLTDLYVYYKITNQNILDSGYILRIVNRIGTKQSKKLKL